MADDFLKNLQESLNSGEKNDDLVKHLEEIDKKADELTSNEAAELLTKRIEDEGDGFAKEMSEDEREKAEEELAELMAEQKENDERLRFLANIEQRNSEIEKLKAEFESVKKGYAVKIEKIQEIKINLMAEFEVKYGEKAEDSYDFGPEPNTDLE